MTRSAIASASSSSVLIRALLQEGFFNAKSRSRERFVIISNMSNPAPQVILEGVKTCGLGTHLKRESHGSYQAMAIVIMDNHSRAHIQSVIAAQANLHTCTWLHLYSGSLHSSGIPAPKTIVNIPPFTFSSSSSESCLNCFPLESFVFIFGTFMSIRYTICTRRF